MVLNDLLQIIDRFVGCTKGPTPAQGTPQNNIQSGDSVKRI